MKKLKTTLSFILLIFIAASGLLFGCDDKYKDLKITTNVEDGITLYLGEDTETNKPSQATFEAYVEGAGEDVSTKLRYSFSNRDIVSVISAVNEDNKTTFTIMANDNNSSELGTSTVLTLITEEGQKTTDILINVVYKLTEIQVKNSYKPFVVINATSYINTADALTFLPNQTTQKAVKYSMVGNYAGVTVDPSGLITATSEAQSGTFEVVATSVDNTAISSDPILVSVIKPINKEDIILMHGENQLNGSLFLSTNWTTESTKLVDVVVDTELVYDLSYNVLSPTNIDIVEGEIIGNNQINFTAVNAGDAVLEIVVKSKQFNYEQSVNLAVNIEEIATNISVDGNTENATYNIYDIYNNSLGRYTRVVVGEQTAKDKRFVLSVDSLHANKISIVNASNKPLDLYDGISEEFSILDSGSSFYIKIKEGYQPTKDDIFDLVITAYGSIGLNGEPTTNVMTLVLRKGVSNIDIYNDNLADDMLMVAVGDENEKYIDIAIDEFTYTEFIRAEYTSTNIELEDVINYKDVVFSNGKAIFTFNIVGKTEGTAKISFYAENGINTELNVRVYTKINAVQITAPTINDDHDIGELKYNNKLIVNNEETKVITLSDISIALGGVVNLNVNPYYIENGNAMAVNGKIKSVTFEVQQDSNYINLGANGILSATNTGNAVVTMTAVVYTDMGEETLAPQTFNVTVYVAIESLSLNSGSIVLYTADNLGYYDKHLSSFEFKINAYPNNVKNNNGEILSEKDFQWTISGNDSSSIDVDPTNNNKISVSSIKGGGTTGSAQITAIYRQFERTYILKAQIKIEAPSRVQQIYNLSILKNGRNETIKKSRVYLGVDENDNDIYTDAEEYYIYLDARDGIGSQNKFNVNCLISPANVLNGELVYLYDAVDKTEDEPIIQIAEDNSIIANRAGICRLYICSKDSAIDGNNTIESYNTKQVIYIKIADGTTESTSLEISDASGLSSINNNVESLELYYIITQDINLASITNWKPIGLINGQVYPFNGMLNGLVNKNGDYILSNIFGLSINETNDNNENYFGLFAEIGEFGYVKNINLSVQNLKINTTANSTNAYLYFGGIAAVNNGYIQNVSVDYLSHNTDNYNYSAKIIEQSFNSFVGGVVGANLEHGKITNCYSAGTLNVVKRAPYLQNCSSYIGGLVGQNKGEINGTSYFVNSADVLSSYNSTINLNACCTTENSITETNRIIYGTTAVGGLVGENLSTLKNASFNGSVNGTSNIGGAVGINGKLQSTYNAKIENVFSSSYVSGLINVGGLVGKLTDGGLVENSCVNIYDIYDINYQEEITPNISGNVNVGGLVGEAVYSEFGNVNIKNSFVKSYFVRNTDNYIADLLGSFNGESAYIGGLVGKATNTQIINSYANLKIAGKNTPNDTASYGINIGGLVGYADNILISNSYARGTIQNYNYAGNVIGYLQSNSSIEFVYSTINENNSQFLNTLVGINNGNTLNANNSYYLSNSNGTYSRTATELKSINNYNGWNISNQNKNSIWYLNDNYNNGYPSLTLNGVVLGVEAPNKITLTVNADKSKIVKITNDLNVIVWKNSSQQKNKIKFTDLYNYEVSPSIAGTAFTLTTSDSNIIKVSGSSNIDYYLEIKSIGNVVLTVRSLLNNQVKVEINIKVLNALENFGIYTSQSLNEEVQTVQSFVGKSTQLYINHNKINNLKIRIYSPRTNAQNIKINNNKLTEAIVNGNTYYQVVLDGNDKLYILSDIALTEDLYIMPYIDIDGTQIDLLDGAKCFTYTTYYGITDLRSSVNEIELDLKNSLTITFTVLGDDLRLNGKLPNFTLLIDNNEYLNYNLLSAIVYNNSTKLTADNNESFAEPITKIEYRYAVSVNTQKALEYFNAENNKKVESIDFIIGAKVKLVNEGTQVLDKQEIVETTLINVKILRQALQNIGIDFYANAEKKMLEDGTIIYNVNEVSTQKIVAGQNGLLRISLYPNIADINDIKVYVDNTEYTFAMTQVLKYVGEDKVNYLERKPYAPSINNSLGLQLYKESNMTDLQQQTVNFDGFLYVSCIIPTIVPEGTVFNLTVEVNYNNGKTLVKNMPLYSDIASSLQVEYKFNDQTLTKQALIAYNYEETVTIKVTRLDIQEISELDEKRIKDLNIIIKDQNGNEIKDASKVIFKYIDKTTVGSVINLRYKLLVLDTDITSISIKSNITKIINNQQSTFESNEIILKLQDYVVTSLTINDNNNGNRLVLHTNTVAKLSIKLTANYEEGNIAIEESIEQLKTEILSNLQCWFAKQTDQDKYSTLTTDNKYSNYKISKDDNGLIQIKPTKESKGEYIYCIVRLVNNTIEILNETNINTVEGIDVKNGNVAQVLKDYVSTDFQNDNSVTDPIPVNSARDFWLMGNGSAELGVYHYGLNADIVLDGSEQFDYETVGNGYVPRDINYISLEGNQHTITIRNFDLETIEESDVINLGLFGLIDENSKIQNLNIVLELDNAISYKNSQIPTINFGVVAGQNKGVIYNTHVSGSVVVETMTGVNSITEAYVAGFVGQNEGYITHSQSEVNINTNRGYIAGFASYNSGKIASSKVVIKDNANIKNLSDTELLSKTGGFVANNTGSISTSYVEGETTNNKLLSYTSVGGFAYQNSGTIQSCYSALKVESNTRSSGFVYTNSQVITGCYSNCLLESNNAAHNPFTGIDSNGTLLNSGTIEDCYYFGTTKFGSTSKEPAVKVENSSIKSSFAKFVFATDTLNGTWSIDGRPKLIDADLVFARHREFSHIDEKGRYIWDEDNSYGSLLSPRVISSFEEFQSNIYSGDISTTDNHFVIVKDIECAENIAPTTSTQIFDGVIFGNNYTFSNIYLNAEINNSNTYYGLFAQLNKAMVKDLTINVRQVVANNIPFVGVLSGVIRESNVSNITINSTNLVVQGQYFVGGIAGLVVDSNITSVKVTASIHANYRGVGTTEYANNFSSSHLEWSNNNREVNYIAENKYSYAGVIAAVITGKNSQVKNIEVIGDNKVIGYYASSGVGLVDTNSKLSYANITVEQEQYVRAFYIAGGVVAENRGIVEYCSIAHNANIQSAIDTTNTLFGRNLTFFAGTPKIIGGLIGLNNGGSIQYSYSKIDVRNTTDSTYIAGGLVGTDIKGTINGCYATGSVITKYIIGGLVGSVSTADYIKEPDNQGEQTTTNNSYILSKEATIITDVSKKTVITNCFASNRWLTLIPQGTIYSDIELLAQFTLQKGLFIGCINYEVSAYIESAGNGQTATVNKTTGTDNIIYNKMFGMNVNSNNYVNTQYTTKLTASITDNCELINQVFGTTYNLENMCNYLTIGGVSGNFNGSSTEKVDEATISSMTFVQNKVQGSYITFYNIVNFDGLMNFIYESQEGSNFVNQYNMVLPNSVQGNIYPYIVTNINK